MRCPQCRRENIDAQGVCPECGFKGDIPAIEELSHLDWLLDEMVKWAGLGFYGDVLLRLKKYYGDRRLKAQVALGLRPQPFSPPEAQAAWPEYLQHVLLFDEMKKWQVAGQITDAALPAYANRMEKLRLQLEGYQRPAYPRMNREWLEVVNFMLAALPALTRAKAFTSPEAKKQIKASLLAEQANLETLLGLRAAPVAPVTAGAPQAAPAPAAPPAPPAGPPRPFMESVWRSILSERTLHALIFLGIFLLFTAAISFVVWGWADFSAPVRVAIPTGFTLAFLGLGWLVRTKTSLYRSGIALTAIAALFVPIDCYTVYANYGSPPNQWQAFWLATSIFSLLAYILLALQVQSRFFGYLVGVAAGSTVLAGIELSGLSRDWYSAGLSVLAVGMLFAAAGLTRPNAAGRSKVFIDPFRYLALWIPAVLMPLSLVLWLVTRNHAFDALHNAMTVDWFLGGFIFGWGAVRYRSRGLGRLAAMALPLAVYMAQDALFQQFGINPAWHAFGLACLTPLYLYTGYRLWLHKDDPILAAHARTANSWGTLLVIAAALYSLTDLASGSAAAASHAVLAASMAMCAVLWKRPNTLYIASFFSFTAATFAMTGLHLKLNQLGVGWVSLAILHILLAIWLGREHQPVGAGLVPARLVPALVVAGYGLAALAVLPPILLFDGNLLAYMLGNFIALAAWGAALAYRRRSGFYAPPAAEGRPAPLFYPLLKTGAIYHWLAALPLPCWLWVVVTNQHAPDFSLVLALATLAWGMVAASHWLTFTDRACRSPWRFTGLLLSVVAPVLAFNIVSGGYTPSITLLAAGLLYFADALAHLHLHLHSLQVQVQVSRHSSELYPAGLVTALGLVLLLDHAKVNAEVVTLALCLLIGVYFLSGLFAERRKPAFAPPGFVTPLYHTAHLLSLVALARIYWQPLDSMLGGPAWTDQMQLWGCIDQLLLGTFYALFAWGRYQKPWAYIAIWLAAAGGGFLALIYSEGQGTLAAKGALIVVALILAERGMYALKRSARIPSRRRATIRLAWGLYCAPLLHTGWAASVIVIGLALVRNLVILGGGQIQQTWAAVGLLVLTALYALSARMFRQARFVWFAVCLAFIPWTIFANLGWFTAFKPALPDFALSWLGLAWLYFLLSLPLRHYAPAAYARPLQQATQLLVPFSLVWASADVPASRYTFGLAIALYALAAWLDHRQARRQSETGAPVGALAATKFLYPALGLVPLWCVYLLKYWQPGARHEHFGLLLLAFGALGLLAGRLLEYLAPHPALKRAYGLPAYITAYVALLVGLLLTAHIAGLLAFALLYAALLMAVSARMFRSPLWVYPAAALMALSLLTALGEAGIPVERRGWWLIGLAAVYLGAGWLLRRFRLHAYATGTITIAFALIALGLPPSSQDRVGAFWGYGSAALLYALSAFWLEQPILLAPACVLIVVPYASALEQSPIPAQYYGLLLLPGALLALGAGLLLDARRGAWRDFPWPKPAQWFPAFAQRMLGWWALSPYLLGFGLASAAPFFTTAHTELAALNFALLAVFYAWAVFRFRARFWLLAVALAAHLATGLYLQYLGWWKSPAEAWLRFLPLTFLTAAFALGLEKRLKEGSPLQAGRTFSGWSRPLYLFVLADIVLAQFGSLRGSLPAMWVTLAHALLIAVLACAWEAGGPAYFSTLLGVVALLQWRLASSSGMPVDSLTVHLAWLALGYGLFGFGYRLFLRWDARRHPEEASSGPPWLALWEIPLQRSAMLLSIVALGLAPFLGINIISWTLRFMFGMSFRDVVEPETVWTVIRLFSLVGLLYSAAAAVYRQRRLGYLAVGFLLGSWFLYAFYINIWDNLRDLQWYALPAGLYLLIIAYVEWALGGSKNMARWLDYAAMLLLLGSLFWQTMSFGLAFAVVLAVEGLAVFGWGILRRLRRFFYAGMAGVMLATLGQLVNGLQTINQWLIFGIIGLMIVLAGIIVERNLEAIKAWQVVLETWE